jgi:hypothetical protein
MSRAWSLYSKWLNSYPLQTNLVTSFFVGFFGDRLAQSFERVHDSEDRETAVHSKSNSIYRSVKVGTFFVCSSFPLFHWYRFLDVRFPTTVGKVPLKKAIRRVIPKVLSNQCIAAPVNNSFFYTFVICFDHIFQDTHGPRVNLGGDNRPALTDTVKAKLTAEMPTTTRNSFCFFGPLHTMNFLFLPSHTRILFNSVAGVSWVCYLSIMGHKRDL